MKEADKMKKMAIKRQKIEPIYTRIKTEKPRKISAISSTCLDEATVERVFSKSYKGMANIDFQVSKTIDLEVT